MARRSRLDIHRVCVEEHVTSVASRYRLSDISDSGYYVFDLETSMFSMLVD